MNCFNYFSDSECDDIDDISDNKQIPQNTSLNCTHETAVKQKNSSNCNSTFKNQTRQIIKN